MGLQERTNLNRPRCFDKCTTCPVLKAHVDGLAGSVLAQCDSSGHIRRMRRKEDGPESIQSDRDSVAFPETRMTVVAWVGKGELALKSRQQFTDYVCCPVIQSRRVGEEKK